MDHSSDDATPNTRTESATARPVVPPPHHARRSTNDDATMAKDGRGKTTKSTHEQSFQPVRARVERLVEMLNECLGDFFGAHDWDG
jgi:hypothetical protein